MSLNMSKCDNRARWPWLAEAVDNFRSVFGQDVQVVNIYEGEKLVAGRPIQGVLVQPYVDGLKNHDENASQRPYKGRRAEIFAKR